MKFTSSATKAMRIIKQYQPLIKKFRWFKFTNPCLSIEVIATLIQGEFNHMLY